MSRKLIHTYTFDKDTNTIVLDEIYGRERILLINNATRNVEMFAFNSEFNTLASYSFNGPEESTTLVLNHDCSSYADNDVLQIWVEIDSTYFSPNETYTDPVSKFRVSQPENLIDTDFEYGLQSTKWETLELVKNIPTFFSRNGDADIQTVDITTQANSSIVTVQTVDVHNLVQGNPIIVQGATNNICNGAFVVTKVVDTTTFQYTAKRANETTESIRDTYTQVFLGSIYQGTEFKLSNINGITTDGADPSELTVTTKYPMAFNQDTSFFLTNSVGQKIVNFNAASTTTANYSDRQSTVDVNTPTGETDSWAIGAWDPLNFKPKDAFYFIAGTGANKTVTIDSANETFTFTTPHGFTDGQYVVYLRGYGNGTIGGLNDTRPYWVRVVNANTIYLTLGGATSTAKVNITDAGSTNGVIRSAFVKAYRPLSINLTTEQITFEGNVPYVSSATQAMFMTYTTMGGLPVLSNNDVLTDWEPSGGQTVYSRNFSQGVNAVMQFSTTPNGAIYNLTSGTIGGAMIVVDTNPLRDTLWHPNHALNTGDVIRLSANTNTIPISNNNYWEVEVINTNRYRVRRYDQTGLWNMSNYGDVNAVYTVYSYSHRLNADQLTAPNHGLSNGNSVVYTNQGGTTIGGLTNGLTYYVAESSTNTLKLATTVSGFDGPNITIDNSWVGSNPTNGYINSNYQEIIKNAHGFATGDRVQYTSNTPVGGLVNGGYYYVRVINVNSFYLYNTSAGAIANSGHPDRIWFSQVLTGTSRIRKVSIVDITTAGTGTQRLTASVEGASDGVYAVSTTPTPTTFTMHAAGQIPVRTIQFDPASSVSIEQNAVRIPDHYFRTGYEVAYTTLGTATGGLTDSTNYYIIRVSRNWIKFATTYDNAVAGTAITLSSVGSGLATLTTSNIIGEVLGQGTISTTSGEVDVIGANTNFSSFFKTGDTISMYQSESFTTRTVSSIDVSADSLTTSVSHGFSNGDMVIMYAETNPGGLISGYFYYVRAISATAVTLHPTRTGAINNTGLINITTVGVGVELWKLNNIGATYQSTVEAVLSTTRIKLTGGADATLTGQEYAVGTGLLIRSDGFALHRPYDGGVELIPSTNPDSQMIRQTRKYFRYQSGKGIQVSFAVNFRPTVSIERIESDGTTGLTRVYTKFPHRLTTGLQITISGAPSIDEAGTFVDFYNGVQTITSVPDDYSFEFTLATFPSTAQSTGAFAEFYVNAWQNSALRCGLFDDQNGMYFEFDGQELKVCRRSSTQQISGYVSVAFGEGVVTGTNTKFLSQLNVGGMIVIKGQSYLITAITSDTTLYIAPSYRGTSQSKVIVTKTIDTKIPQTAWNLDVCDGTGPTGYYLNLSRIQMAYMDYSWYGAGKVRFGFKDQHGNVKYVHEFIHNNKFSEAYLRSGNLPARYDIQNIGQPTYVPALAHWGTSVIMDGRFDDDKAYIFTASSQSVQLTGTNTLTVTGRSAYTGYYYAYVQNQLRAIGYALEVAPSSTYNTLTSGLSITGANLTGFTRNPQDGRVSPQQPYLPSILSSAGYNFNFSSRNLVVVDRAPSGTAGTNTAYTVTLAGTTQPVVYDIPLISIRLAPSVDTNTPGFLGEREIVNRMQLILKSVGILTTHACEIVLRLNGQIDNSAWQRVTNPSLSQLIYHTNKDTITGGNDIYSFRAEGGAGTTARTPVVTSEQLEEVATLGNSILGGNNTYPDGPDVLTIVAKLTEDPSLVTTANPFTITGRISWTESQA